MRWGVDSLDSEVLGFVVGQGLEGWLLDGLGIEVNPYFYLAAPGYHTNNNKTTTLRVKFNAYSQFESIKQQTQLFSITTSYPVSPHLIIFKSSDLSPHSLLRFRAGTQFKLTHLVIIYLNAKSHSEHCLFSKPPQSQPVSWWVLLPVLVSQRTPGLRVLRPGTKDQTKVLDSQFKNQVNGSQDPSPRD